MRIDGLRRPFSRLYGILGVRHAAQAPGISHREFSLIGGDPLDRFERAAGIASGTGECSRSRAVKLALFAWLPVAAWAAFVGRLVSSTESEPFIAQISLHVRYLLSVPLLIISEAPARRALMETLDQLVAAEIIDRQTEPRLRAELGAIAELRTSPLPWISILIAILVIVWSRLTTATAQPDLNWALIEAGGERVLGFGAAWLLFVSSPIYLALVLRWVWRAFLTVALLWKISRFPLNLVPTHSDQAGGLGVVGRLPRGFFGVLFGVSASLAARFAHEAHTNSLSLEALGWQIGILTALMLLITLLPSAVFIGPLVSMKRRAILEYGELVSRHGRLVRRKWIEGASNSVDPMLSASELGPLCDVNSMYAAVKVTRVIPTGRDTLLAVGLPILIPFLPLMALHVPLQRHVLELLSRLI